MKYIEFEEHVFIPANKICNVIKDPKDDKTLVFWLDGGQEQGITFANKEDRDRNYSLVTNHLKDL